MHAINISFCYPLFQPDPFQFQRKDICCIKSLLEVMEKKSPFFTASVASIAYFIIFFLLKYLLQDGVADWWGAVQGAVVFWAVIFLVHQFLIRRYG